MKDDSRGWGGCLWSAFLFVFGYWAFWHNGPQMVFSLGTQRVTVDPGGSRCRDGVILYRDDWFPKLNARGSHWIRGEPFTFSEQYNYRLVDAPADIDYTMELKVTIVQTFFDLSLADTDYEYRYDYCFHTSSEAEPGQYRLEAEIDFADSTVRIPYVVNIAAADNAVISESPAMPTITPTSEGTIVAFADDFAGPTCLWYEYSDSDVEVGCAQNRYRFGVNKPGLLYVALPTAPEVYTDFALWAEAEQTEGPEVSLHGVVFRYQDITHYYLFAIRSDGHYIIAKNEDGFQPLVEWTPSELINSASNSLGVVAAGSEIAVSVNDNLLDWITDDSYSDGSVGLAVGTFPDQDGAPVVYFDDFQVRVAR